MSNRSPLSGSKPRRDDQLLRRYDEDVLPAIAVHQHGCENARAEIRSNARMDALPNR
jgi:hypothetical protein